MLHIKKSALALCLFSRSLCVCLPALSVHAFPLSLSLCPSFPSLHLAPLSLLCFFSERPHFSFHTSLCILFSFLFFFLEPISILSLALSLLFLPFLDGTLFFFELISLLSLYLSLSFWIVLSFCFSLSLSLFREFSYFSLNSSPLSNFGSSMFPSQACQIKFPTFYTINANVFIYTGLFPYL